MKLLQRFSFTMLLMSLMTLVACGGGDGGLSRDGDNGGETPSTISLSLSIDHTDVSNVNPGIITALVTDSGNAVAGTVVTFTTTLGNLSPDSGTALTDSEGKATIIITAGSVEGAGEVTATISSGETSKVGFSSAGDGAPDGSTKTISVTIDNPTVSQTTPRTLTATLLENGQVVVGEVVTFTSTLGSFDPELGTVLTDLDGKATITLKAGNVKGAGVVTVVSMTQEAASVGFSTLGDAIAGTRNIVMVISNQTIDNATPATLTATVTDSDGTAIANTIVTFSSSLGVLDPSSSTALTDGSGVATITLKAGTIKGAGTAKAVLETGEFNTITFVTQGDGFIANGKAVVIELVDANTLGYSVSAAQPRVLKATVTEDGTQVVGEVVTFSSTLGTLNPISGTVLTDANGEAAIQLTAGSVKGAGIAKASLSSGASNEVGFSSEGDIVSGVAIRLELTDANGVPLNPRQINSTTPGKVVATVSGIVEPVLVTFSTDLGDIPIPTAITDNNDTAVVDVFADGALGAGTINATLSTGESAQLVFAIGASSLGMGTQQADNQIIPAEDNISAGGTTSVPVTIWDTSQSPAVPFTDSVEVSFSSICGSSGKSIIDSPVTTVNGVAVATYRAQGCEITDTITATANAGGVVLSASGTVSVSAASVGSLLFVSATPEVLAIKGTGATGTSESSTLIFKLLDTSGKPMENEEVCFSLNTNVGNAKLTPLPAAGTTCAVGTDASNTTDSSGNVTVTVNSGSSATTVRVTALADVNGTQVKTQSSNLVISTGIPDQDSMSLSADILNPEAWNHDGEIVKVTARLADAFNNPVPDGTTILFTTEGGAIEPSCQTTKGACTVDWTSQNPRPEGKELLVEGVAPATFNVMGQKYGGRATILATAQGNESFPDLNGNGVFDSEEEADFAGNNVSGKPYDLAEAFVDYNEDGVYSTRVGSEVGGELEVFTDFNGDNTYNDADGKYNGVLCGTASICSTDTSVNVRDSLTLVMSSSGAVFTTTQPAGGATIVINGEGTANASVIIADIHNQPMPAGSSVVFSVAGFGSVASQASFTWPNENHNGGLPFAVTVKGEKDNLPKSGTLWVTVTTPKGVESNYAVANILIQ